MRGMVSRRWWIVVIVTLGLSCHSSGMAFSAKSKETYCDRFVMMNSCGKVSWVGVYRDLFSPDDQACPKSLRYIDLDHTTNELQVSASGTGKGCKEEWGRRFDKTTVVNPVLSVSARDPCKATNF